MKPIDNTYKGEIHKELTISFNKKGVITGVRTAIDNNSYVALLHGSNSNVDLRMRREILNFVENFRSYYVEKNINALQEIFSEDALIITGRVIKTLGKNNIEGVSQKVNEKMITSKQNKQQYINNLRNLFKGNEFINVDFSDIELMRHGSNPNIYGVRLRQKWNSQQYNGRQYSDDGYVFLLWDFQEEGSPKIHVRTWTPKRANQTKDDFSPEDFFIPNN